MNKMVAWIDEKELMDKQAKPFLKWAGGKTQLLLQIEQQLPTQVINKPFTYIEPFVGSGAISFGG